MARDADIELLETALALGAIRNDQHEEAMRILLIVRQTGLRTSAGAILLEKGFLTPDGLKSVEMALADGGADRAPVEPTISLDDAFEMEEEGPAAEAQPPPPEPEAPRRRSASDEAEPSGGYEIDAEAALDVEGLEREFEGAATPAPEAVPPEPVPPQASPTDEPDLSALAEGGVEDEEAGPVSPVKMSGRYHRRHGVRISAGDAKRWIAVAVGCVALVLAWWIFARAVPSWRQKSLEAALRAADQKYGENKPEAALEMYRDVAAATGEAAKTAHKAVARIEQELKKSEELYKRGEELARNGDFLAAAGVFQTSLGRYPLSGRFHRYAVKGFARAKAKVVAQALTEGGRLEAQTRWHDALTYYAKVLNYDTGGQLQSRLDNAAGKARAFDELVAQAARAARGRDAKQACRLYQRALDVCHGHAKAHEPLSRLLRQVPPPKGMALVAPGEVQVGCDEGDADDKEDTP